jgi:hypothetical protein
MFRVRRLACAARIFGPRAEPGGAMPASTLADWPGHFFTYRQPLLSRSRRGFSRSGPGRALPHGRPQRLLIALAPFSAVMVKGHFGRIAHQLGQRLDRTAGAAVPITGQHAMRERMSAGIARITFTAHAVPSSVTLKAHTIFPSQLSNITRQITQGAAMLFANSVVDTLTGINLWGFLAVLVICGVARGQAVHATQRTPGDDAVWPPACPARRIVNNSSKVEVRRQLAGRQDMDLRESCALGRARRG